MSKKIPEYVKSFLNSRKPTLKTESDSGLTLESDEKSIEFNGVHTFSSKPKPLVETYEYLKWDGGVTINNLIKNSYEIAKEKGWWDEDRDIPHILSLIHSEVSEALEEYRDHGDNIFEFGGRSSNNHGFVFELADIMIRVADLAGKYNFDLERAIKEKTAHNSSREHRHGGKSA